MQGYNTITGKRHFLETVGYNDVGAMSDGDVIVACCAYFKRQYNKDYAEEIKKEYYRWLDVKYDLIKPVTLRDKLNDCECVCYFFYGEDDKLLYVGKANDFFVRWNEHKKQKDISKIKRFEFHAFDSLPDALFYEVQMILALSPKWNKRDTKGTKSNFSIAPASIIHASIDDVLKA
jgi:hypothetical protein